MSRIWVDHAHVTHSVRLNHNQQALFYSLSFNFSKRHLLFVITHCIPCVLLGILYIEKVTLFRSCPYSIVCDSMKNHFKRLSGGKEYAEEEKWRFTKCLLKLARV